MLKNYAYLGKSFTTEPSYWSAKCSLLNSWAERQSLGFCWSCFCFLFSCRGCSCPYWTPSSLKLLKCIISCAEDILLEKSLQTLCVQYSTCRFHVVPFGLIIRLLNKLLTRMSFTCCCLEINKMKKTFDAQPAAALTPAAESPPVKKKIMPVILKPVTAAWWCRL